MNRKRSKWSYAIGCTGRDMCYTLVSMFLLMYIQFSGLMNPEQYAVMFLVIGACRVWDAVNDPMMGTIISNTKTRLGKYRPWLIGGALSNAIFLILMFTLRFSDGWANVIALSILYLLWETTFTMNDVSYWSLLPALADDKEDRDKLTSMVAIFASIGAFTAAGLVPMFTTNDTINGYRTFGIIFAIVFILCQLLVFFFTHDNKYDKFILTKEELAQEPQEKEATLKDMFKILFRNKQLLVMGVVVLLYTTASGFLVSFGQNLFYFKFGYYGDKVFVFTIIYAAGTLISQALCPILTKKFKRNQLVKVSLFATIIGYVLFFIVCNLPINPDIAFILLCLFGMLIFCGQGVFYLVMLIMLTNTIEYDEWQTGERNEAVTFSVRPFMVKLSSAIQTILVSGSLLIFGLINITNEIGKLEEDKNYGIITEDELNAGANALLATAEKWQLFGLSAAMTLIPIIMFVVSYILIKKKYIIDEDLYDLMIKEIEERKRKSIEE